MTNTFEPDVVHQFEHDTWSRCAEGYLDGFAGLTRETLPSLVEAGGAKGDQRVLEIGSGPGHIADALRKAGAEVTGVDFSGPMVEVARRHYPEVAFEEASADDLPFEDESFDAAVANFVVHHLARPEAAFREVCRVLKSGARFAFSVFAKPEEQSSIGAFFAAVEANYSLDELPHGPLFGVTDLKLYESMLEAAGLTDPKFEFKKITWQTTSLEPVVESFWSWGNMAALPDAMQSKIESMTRDNLSVYRRNKGYAFPHEVLIGSAAKS